MFVLRASYHGRAKAKVYDGISYISHREERLADGRTRALHGLGSRYRQACGLPGSEPWVKRTLWEDGDGLYEPRYYRLKLTVDDVAAQDLLSLTPARLDTAICTAVEQAMRAALPLAQGVYVTHTHGGRGRPFGHPHAHVHLSPVLEVGGVMRLPKHRLRGLRARWEKEVVRSLERSLVGQRVFARPTPPVAPSPALPRER